MIISLLDSIGGLFLWQMLSRDGGRCAEFFTSCVHASGEPFRDSWDVWWCFICKGMDFEGPVGYRPLSWNRALDSFLFSEGHLKWMSSVLKYLAQRNFFNIWYLVFFSNPSFLEKLFFPKMQIRGLWKLLFLSTNRHGLSIHLE